MKKFPTRYRIAMIFLCTLLAAGCAEKPTPVPLSSRTEPSATTPVAATPASGVHDSGAGEAKLGAQPATRENLPASGFKRIHFAFDQCKLSSEARQVLNLNAALLKGNPDVRVRIEGNCDNRGSDEYNLALGERRAKAAKDYLVSLGVAPRRLEVISYGEEMPLDPANTREAWAKNRRDDFKILN